MIKFVPSVSRLLPVLIALLFLIPAIVSMQHDDITYDEQDHLQYGIHLLKGNSHRFVEGRDFNTTMPVTALNALPRAVEQLVHPGLQKNDWGESDIKKGRYLTVLVSLALLYYIFLFARSLGGNAAGCWAMFLAATDPNILAHGRLVTTDPFATLSLVMTFHHLHAWLVKKQPRHFYAWCIAIAFAQCCKVNNILLYPLCAAAIMAFRKSAPAAVGKKYVLAKQLFVFAAVQLLLINAFFLFYGTGLPLSAYACKSTFFQQWQQSFLAQIPLPLPASYIQTFDLVRYEQESFDAIPMNYLLGELRHGRGFVHYYAVCWLLKTPLLTQALLFFTVFMALRQPAFRKGFIFFFLLPAGLFLLLLSTSSVQSGYRYLLPLLSLLYVFSGPALVRLVSHRPAWLAPALAAVPMIVMVLSLPNFIAYTNAFITDKTNAWRYLADSNLNWGQRHQQIRSFLADHPAYLFEPEKPTEGTIVADVNNLAGIFDAQRLAWLRAYEPVGTFADCYVIFNVKDLAKKSDTTQKTGCLLPRIHTSPSFVQKAPASKWQVAVQ